ncbi:mucosa-associated lymphoid tissue lymphoma translocation protein 1 homolog [Oscarella lobularis]|uniref:mucosa-associated lymphoid tissue lymphoma translocation protein 1 homolog n=1 Tax=Oscarella lobularis TaxID=121494 RepID=UPI0033132F8C
MAQARLLSDFLDHCHDARNKLFNFLNLRLEGKDWRTLADHLGLFGWREIQLIEQRERNPCEYVLRHHLTLHPQMTLFELYEILRTMQREDVMEVIEKYLRIDVHFPPSYEESMENFSSLAQPHAFPTPSAPVEETYHQDDDDDEDDDDDDDDDDDTFLNTCIRKEDLDRPVQGKVALLIGNQNYGPPWQLNTPHLDVKDLKRELKELGFKVFDLVDLTKEEFCRAIIAFTMQLKPHVYVVFFFAGHGFEGFHRREPETFLMPVDASFSPPQPDECIPLQETVLDTIQECNTAMNLIIVDTCRKRLSGNSDEGRATRRSINLRARGNTVFAYSTSRAMKAFEPKSPLAELPSRNSVYVSSLKKYLRQDEPVERILKLASQDILRERGPVQVPAVMINLIRDCKLTDRVPGPPELTSLSLASHEKHLTVKGFSLKLMFCPTFGNVLRVTFFIANKNSFRIEDFRLRPAGVSNKRIEAKVVTQKGPDKASTYVVEMELHHIQRLEANNPFKLTLAMSYREVLDPPQPGVQMVPETHNIEVNLEEPLCAMIGELDWWMANTELSDVSSSLSQT